MVTLVRMSPISNNSYNWTFNSLSSVGAIRYGALDVGVVPGTKFMAKSISLAGGNLGKPFRKASRNSHATVCPQVMALQHDYPQHERNPPSSNHCLRR